jgi:hypothetical protein
MYNWNVLDGRLLSDENARKHLGRDLFLPVGGGDVCHATPSYARRDFGGIDCDCMVGGLNSITLPSPVVYCDSGRVTVHWALAFSAGDDAVDRVSDELLSVVVNPSVHLQGMTRLVPNSQLAPIRLSEGKRINGSEFSALVGRFDASSYGKGFMSIGLRIVRPNPSRSFLFSALSCVAMP